MSELRRGLIFCAVAIPIALAAGIIDVFVGGDICEAIEAHGGDNCAFGERLTFVQSNAFVYALKSIVWIFIGVFAGIGAVLFADMVSGD